MSELRATGVVTVSSRETTLCPWRRRTSTMPPFTSDGPRRLAPRDVKLIVPPLFSSELCATPEVSLLNLLYSSVCHIHFVSGSSEHIGSRGSITKHIVFAASCPAESVVARRTGDYENDSTYFGVPVLYILLLFIAIRPAAKVILWRNTTRKWLINSVSRPFMLRKRLCHVDVITSCVPKSHTTRHHP